MPRRAAAAVVVVVVVVNLKRRVMDATERVVIPRVRVVVVISDVCRGFRSGVKLKDEIGWGFIRVGWVGTFSLSFSPASYNQVCVCVSVSASFVIFESSGGISCG